MNEKTDAVQRVIGLDSHPDTFTAAVLAGTTPATAIEEKTCAKAWRATLTLGIVQWNRNRRVCSFCGKKPARDYQFTNLYFGNETPVALRLCGEGFDARCHIQKEQPLPMAA